MSNVKFCWLCSKKLWNGISEELTIDDYRRTLHKSCAKEVKTGHDYSFRDGRYSERLGWIIPEDNDF